MNCNNCGTIIPDGQKYCTGCGAPVPQITTQQPKKSPFAKKTQMESQSVENIISEQLDQNESYQSENSTIANPAQPEPQPFKSTNVVPPPSQGVFQHNTNSPFAPPANQTAFHQPTSVPVSQPTQNVFLQSESNNFSQPIQPVFQKANNPNSVYQQPIYQQESYQQPIYQQPINNTTIINTNDKGTKKHGLTVAALILAVFALIFCFARSFNVLLSIPSIVLSIIGLAKKNNDKVRAIVALFFAIPAFLLGCIVNSKPSKSKTDTTTQLAITQDTILQAESNIISESVWASMPTSLDRFEYKLNVYDKEIIIDSYEGEEEKVWIAYEYDIDGDTYKVDLDNSAVFFGNGHVKSIIIEEGIQTVASNCFNSCRNLEYIYIPNTVVRNSGSGIFGYFHELKEFYYGGSNNEFREYSKTVRDDELKYIPVYVNSVLQKDGSGVIKGELYDKNIDIQDVVIKGAGDWGSYFTPISDFRYSIIDNEIVLSRYIGEDTEIVISPYYIIDGTEYPVVSLGDDACFLCETHIKSVYIPEGITHIGSTTFNSCSSLQYIYIPSTVENLESSFFSYLHEYEIVYDSMFEINPDRDTNNYLLNDDELSDAELIGEDAARAVNGFTAGFAGDNEDTKITIYFGGNEDKWNEIAEI